MTKLDLAHATAVLEAGIAGAMFPGPIPEGAGNRITEADHLVELALQAKVVADEIGRENVPAWPALSTVLVAAGIDVDAPPDAVQPDPPAAEYLPDPPDETPPASGLPAAGQRWLDAEGNAWDVVEFDGGAQMQARLVSTGETAVLPTGFLVERSPPEDVSEVAAAPPPERRLCAGNDTVYELELVDGATVFVTDPTGTRMSIALEHWSAWPVQQPEIVAPTPPPAVDPPAPVEQQVEPAAPVEPESTRDTPPRKMQFKVGEHRLSQSDGNAYVLKEIHPNGTVTVTDIYGNGEVTGASADWMSWDLLDSFGVQEPPAAEPDPPAAADEPEAKPPSPELAAQEEAKKPPKPKRGKKPKELEPDQPRHDEQQVVVPEDEDEGDDEYAGVLAKVRDTYQPTAMPAPMDLTNPPSGMPDDLTQVDDVEARRLHSQFNALASRARYLYGLESAKARACDRLYRHHLKGSMREQRSLLGKDASVTEVQQYAEDHEVVSNWMRRRDAHGDIAEAYKTFLAIYSENVTVLSRDWTLRSKELAGS